MAFTISSSKATVYVNGVNIASSSSFHFKMATLGTPSSAVIGNTYSSSHSPTLNAYLGEFKVYSEALRYGLGVLRGTALHPKRVMEGGSSRLLADRLPVAARPW